jgi:hypothetical protein
MINKSLIVWSVTGLSALMPLAMADTGPTPMVVEMFTSKYCPNCPMAEHKLEGVAEENPDVLVIFEHVDYWDRGPRIDPFGLADISQRQYDYSNTLSKRAGEVFTPMPLIDGQIMVSPPLMFTWGSAMEKGKALPSKPRLDVTMDKGGNLNALIPEALYGAGREAWVLGVEPVEGSKVQRVRGIVQAEKNKGGVRAAAATLPKTPAFIVLLQESGPGKLVAMGSYGLQK